jgi:hypothetical protein
VLGIIAYFLFVVITTASGSAPKFFDGATPAMPKDCIVFYVLAFLVGYREETFRELIKRATDLILKPGNVPAAAPAVTFKIGGAAASEIQCPTAAAGANSTVTVDVQNSGTAALVTPTVSLTLVPPTPANTFTLATDDVTGRGDLAPGQSKQVVVRFTPPNAGDFAATLTVASTSLAAPKTIKVKGKTP